MEEIFLQELESQLNRALIDKAFIREQLAVVSELKCRRGVKEY